MIIEAYDLPLVTYPCIKMPIYPHQAVMLDTWMQYDSFLLTSKTGSGKTASWAMAYLANRHLPGEQSVVCIYPTNELIRDQERSIYDFIVNKQGLTCYVWSPEDVTYTAADVELVRVDASALDRYCATWKKRGVKTKGQALLRLLHGDRPKIVLMNPDTLYLLFTLRYSQSGEALGALQGYRTVVFDEFHLYTGVELAHALFMVHLARHLNIFRRVVLLSATPHPQVHDYIDRVLSPCAIDAQTPTSHPILGSRRVIHQIGLKPQRVSTKQAGGAVVEARELLLGLKAELEKRRFDHTMDTEYVPAVVILNSVVSAIDLEDSLRGAGFTANEIVPMRGLMAREARRLQPDQLVIIGTSAVEVGIDFQTDFLLFEASDAASFMQRLGRLGRHGSGTAFLLGDYREYKALSSFDQAIARDAFERAILEVYPQADARAWFVETQLGALTVMAQGYSILRRIEVDRRGNFADKDAIRDWLFATLDSYATRLGINKSMLIACGMYKQHNKAGQKGWIADYEQIDRFRTSLPSVKVTDRAEQRRRRTAYTYEVDVKTLLERAHDLHREGRDYVVDYYERYHPVFTNKNFNDEPDRVGYMLSTRDYPNLMIKRKTWEGTLDVVSHIMSRGDEPHVFVFVPRDFVEDDLDWRLATFMAGEHHPRYLVAFDGDALLLKEIYRRAKAAREHLMARSDPEP